MGLFRSYKKKKNLSFSLLLWHKNVVDYYYLNLCCLGFSSNKAESIFAKYRTQQTEPPTDPPDVPPDDKGALRTPSVEITTSRLPVAPPSSEQSKLIVFSPFYVNLSIA